MTLGLPATQALIRVQNSLAMKLKNTGMQGTALHGSCAGASPTFLCDSGLGGLARWIRAAGYDAEWKMGFDDDELIERAASENMILLTTDSFLPDRRVFKDGRNIIAWVPPTVGVPEQLSMVFAEFKLALLNSRCMYCGGRLEFTAKELVQDRIPPRTARWLDEYYVCARCGKLFWHGTHWSRIRLRLREIHENISPAD